MAFSLGSTSFPLNFLFRLTSSTLYGEGARFVFDLERLFHRCHVLHATINAGE